ncbi:hypothetical protein GALMADRAFT_249638 [Galerina marginata CBS 339.88]|uniref:F-box domain-containing protein n=1 Tax=Galerina marginata (strain CBS 339.88) TaxID=685588 RepID=A0A067T484_GALM3|nr:hypothetical protein GALMADRAFT_249638 [Galerina marginata CBS 339.88]
MPHNEPLGNVPTRSHFFDLSTEVLVEIFSLLFFTDLFTCKRTCGRFYAVISNSILLNYQIELQKAGMLDNPRCTLPLPIRLEMIRTRELAWASFDSKFTTEVQVPSHSLELYDVTAGALFLAKKHLDERFVADGIQSVTLPSKLEDALSPEWKNFDLRTTILDFRPAVDEHDLLACLVLVPEEDQPLVYNVHVVLRQYSDPDSNHSAALKPSIHVYRVMPYEGIPEASVDISGESLAVVLVFPTSVSETRNNLFTYNWKTGEHIKRLPIPVFSSPITFLRHDILLQPNVINNSIHIHQILHPLSHSQSSNVAFSFSLGLPSLVEGYRVSSLSFRGEPGPHLLNECPKFTPTTRPYVHDPKTAIMRLSMQIASDEDEDDQRHFVMIVHRQALLDLLKERQSSNRTSSSRHLSWDSWGPSVTRWLEGEIFLSDFTIDTFGQRCVQLAPPRLGQYENSPRPGNRIHIFDFNPFYVKRVANGGEMLSLLTKLGLEVYVVQGNFSFSFGPGGRQECTEEGVFTETLTGNLPYVEIVRTAWTESEYHGLCIDQERLVAIETDREADTGRILSMDVMYFG